MNIRRCHRITGLVFSPFFLITAITGTVLLWRKDGIYDGETKGLLLGLHNWEIGAKYVGVIQSLIATCKGRLDQLKQTFDRCLAQDDPNFEYVVVDYDCPEGTAAWLRECAAENLVCVKISNRKLFEQSHARNVGARFATGTILVFIDADTLLEPGFLTSVRERLNPNSFMAATMLLTGEKGVGSGAGLQGYGGIIACYHHDWEKVRDFDEHMPGGGGEDDDFKRRLIARDFGTNRALASRARIEQTALRG